MKNFFKKYLFLFSFAGIIIALDQWSKYLIQKNLPLGASWSPWEWLAPYARFVHWYNTGVAFGMFQGKGYIFAIFAVIVSIVIVIYYPQIPKSEWILRVAMGMQMAGALGNLVDRVTVGHVIDFISVGSFPVFNVADASISVGTALMLLGLWLQERKNRGTTDQAKTDKQPESSDPMEIEGLH